MPIEILTGKYRLLYYTGVVIYNLPGVCLHKGTQSTIERVVYDDSEGFRATIVSYLKGYISKSSHSENYKIDRQFSYDIAQLNIEDDSLMLVEEYKVDLNGFEIEGCFRSSNDSENTLRFLRPEFDYSAPAIKSKARVRNAFKTGAAITFDLWDYDVEEIASSKCYFTDEGHIVIEASSLESETAGYRLRPVRGYQRSFRVFNDLLADTKGIESFVSSVSDQRLDGLLSALQIVPSNDEFRMCMQFVWLYEQLKKVVIERKIPRDLTDHRNEIAHGDTSTVDPFMFAKLKEISIDAIRHKVDFAEKK